MSVSKHGVNETKELIKLAFVIAGVIGGELKDGFQFADLLAVFNKMQGDDARKAVLDAALKDVKLVPEEVKDLQGMEILELGLFAGGEVPALVDALAKKA